MIDKDTTALYRFAGISHLLAISGTHVLFLAILLANLVVFLVTVVPTLFRIFSRWEVRLWTAVSVAFLYALFAGFDVPAVRTAMMLLAVGSVRYLLIDVPVLKVLLGLAVIMAWQDIFVLWQAGFWLSFVVVALLMVYGLHYEANGQNGRRNDISHEFFRRSCVTICKTKPSLTAYPMTPASPLSLDTGQSGHFGNFLSCNCGLRLLYCPSPSGYLVRCHCGELELICLPSGYLAGSSCH